MPGLSGAKDRWRRRQHNHLDPVSLQQSGRSDQLSTATGPVKWFDEAKGFGFIQSEDNKDLFVHRSGVKDNVFSLEAGQSVEFEIKENDKGPVAFNVEVV